jgi:DNA-binding NarL/FixJ family response regulator
MIPYRNDARLCGRQAPRRDPVKAATGVALGAREAEALRLATLGLTNKEIAQKMGTSPVTVRNQLYRAYAKLGVRGRITAAALRIWG